MGADACGDSGDVERSRSRSPRPCLDGQTTSVACDSKTGSPAKITGDANGEAIDGENRYGAEFFNRSLDRTAVYTVKYGLRGPLFGESAEACTPLWVADMDLPCAPEILAALQRRVEHPTFGYTFQPPEMWEATRRWLLEEHGWNVPLDAFVFCSGVVTAAAAALWAFTKPGDAVLVMTPLYEPLQNLVKGAGRCIRTHELRLDAANGRYALDPRRLEEDLQGCTLLLFCNPHNPGGRVWSASELRAVTSACLRLGVLVVSDEIWADWSLFGHRHRPLAMDANIGQGVVTLMAPTKTWNLAGLHCSFLVIEDAALRKQYLSSVDYAFLHFGGAFASEAMLAAYAKGRPWLRGAKQYVEAQLLYCEEFLRRRCAPEVVPLRPDATYLLWLDCTALEHQDPAKFFQEEAGVLLSGGAQFGEHTARFARLNCAAPHSVLAAALEKMAIAVDRRRRTLGGDELAPAASTTESAHSLQEPAERKLHPLKQAACVLVRSNDDADGDTVLLVSRGRDTSSWGLPGGKVEPGETVVAAAVRELREETGLKVTEDDLQPVFAKEAGGRLSTCFALERRVERAEVPEGFTSSEGWVRWGPYAQCLEGPFREYNTTLGHTLRAIGKLASNSF